MAIPILLLHSTYFSEGSSNIQITICSFPKEEIVAPINTPLHDSPSCSLTTSEKFEKNGKRTDAHIPK